ncbi:MAG: rhomboid family intramembrane serine protease, partial [Deltaproteobacteria bacterium]|nr:rhomboid family intramembrane serine protease [Deltaproteobacteria bacterium]
MKIRENLKIALLAIAILWTVFLIDRLLPLDLLMYGIRPRQIGGLWGIGFAPFLH